MAETTVATGSAMSDLTIESTDEGGDPACWAHLFEDDADTSQGWEAGANDPRPCSRHASDTYAASEPDSLRATTRS